MIDKRWDWQDIHNCNTNQFSFKCSQVGLIEVTHPEQDIPIASMCWQTLISVRFCTTFNELRPCRRQERWKTWLWNCMAGTSTRRIDGPVESHMRWFLGSLSSDGQPIKSITLLLTVIYKRMMFIFHVRIMHCQFAWLVKPASIDWIRTGFQSDEIPPSKSDDIPCSLHVSPSNMPNPLSFNNDSDLKCSSGQEVIVGGNPTETSKFNFEINVKQNKIHSYLFNEFGLGCHHLMDFLQQNWFTPIDLPVSPQPWPM